MAAVTAKRRRPLVDLARVMTMMSPEWTLAVEAWAAALVAAGRSPQTIGLRTYHVRRLAQWAGERGPWDLTLDELLAWLGSHDWHRSTLSSYRASLRGFYRWAAMTGRVASSPAEGLPTVGAVAPNPRPAPEDAYRRALADAEPRVRLMIRLAADLGLRRGEVARVHTRDVVSDVLGWSLVVHGKGRKIRVVPLPDGLARVLLEQPAGYVFPGDDDGHLSPRWVGKLVSRVLPEGWTMHSLRHRFATLAYSLDRDTFTVQELLGHASPVTTRAYVRVDDDAKRRVVSHVAGRRAA